MRIRSSTPLVLAAAFVAPSLLGVPAVAAPILTFDFTGDPAENSSHAATSVLDANLTLTDGLDAVDYNNQGAGTNSGLLASNFTNAYSVSAAHLVVAPASKSTIVEAISRDQYFAFKIQADAGYELDLNGAAISLAGHMRDFNGADQIYLFSSIGGFAAGNELGFVTLGSHWVPTIAGGSVLLPGAGYDNLAGEVEFRFYVVNGSNFNALAVTSLSLDGAVAAVPEPASLGLLAAGGLLMLGRSRKQG